VQLDYRTGTGGLVESVYVLRHRARQPPEGIEVR